MFTLAFLVFVRMCVCACACVRVRTHAVEQSKIETEGVTKNEIMHVCTHFLLKQRY